MIGRNDEPFGGTDYLPWFPTPENSKLGDQSLEKNLLPALAWESRDGLRGSNYYRPKWRAGLSAMILAPRMYRRRTSNDLWPV